MRQFGFFVLLCLLAISVIVIFNARNILKNRIKENEQNSIVRGCKITFSIIAIICLIFICII